ncbi:DNA topoisomerase 3-beta-like [Glossina fuscipes fuscipes]
MLIHANLHSSYKLQFSKYCAKFGTPSWKLVCNRCDVIINCFKGATKVTVEAEDKYNEWGAQLVSVVYKSDKTKFKDSSEEKTGCIFCSSDFSHSVEKHRAVPSRPVNICDNSGGTGIGRGGRGGGRGNKGRSSGRGSRGGTRPPKDKMAELAAYFV